MPRYIISNKDAQIITKVMREGVVPMKKNYKRLNSSTVSLPEVAAVVLAASVIATSVGCGTGESELIPTESDTQITVVIESDESETVETEVTETSVSVSETEETVPSESELTDETLEATESIAETTATSGGSSNAKPTTQTSVGNGGNTAKTTTTPKPTNTPKPTSTPKPTPNPYKAACICPECGDDVRYHAATTKHHDAVTHEEKTVTYDKEIKTFKYTINWSGNFKSWCSENEVSVPSAPSANGKIVYDNKGKVIDHSDGDAVLNSLTEKAHDLAANLGYKEVAYSYKTKEVGKEYVNRVEHTNTIVDKEAWDEKIPAGWYCDRCDYYSASVPKYYNDLDL